ncbi:hypothetical protein BDR26DRAFT_853180 [Obelidium mucronatum]|nr:hypothetical protein BDR26DRAFT_853180 [Obelidium mucronatum]
MFIAWSVLPPIAIFIARYMKDRMGHNWYLSHKWIMLGGVGIFTIIGIVSVEWSLNPTDSVLRFIGSSNHGIIGTVVALIVYPLQVILGEVSNALWSAERKSIPWWDKAHWWLGRAVVVLAIVNTYLGLVEYGAKVIWIVGYWVWIAVVVFVGFGYFGEVQMGGVVHHVATDSSEEMVVVNPTR